MAIKVIKEGKIKEEPRYRHTCPHCSSVLEYAKSDTYGVEPPAWAIDPRESKIRKLKCPVCRNDIIVSFTNPLRG